MVEDMTEKDVDEPESRIEFCSASSGTIELPAGTSIDMKIHPGDKNIRKVEIFTDDALQFSDLKGPQLFTPSNAGAAATAHPNEIIQSDNWGAGVAIQAYTEIDGGIILDVLPMRLIARRTEWSFRVTNAGAAAAHFQVWVMW